jgi:hypothetical protein
MRSNSFIRICKFKNSSGYFTLGPSFHSRNAAGQEKRVEIAEINGYEQEKNSKGSEVSRKWTDGKRVEEEEDMQ